MIRINSNYLTPHLKKEGTGNILRCFYFQTAKGFCFKIYAFICSLHYLCPLFVTLSLIYHCMLHALFSVIQSNVWLNEKYIYINVRFFISTFIIHTCVYSVQLLASNGWYMPFSMFCFQSQTNCNVW